MTRYFFNVRDGADLARDLEGQELPDLDTARREAELGAREIVADRVKTGDARNDEIIEITDESGMILGRFPLSSLLAP